jgi:hypothetical protein
VVQSMGKSMRSKDGRLSFAAHNPNVGFRAWRNTGRGVPLLCRVLRSNSCNSKNLRMAPKPLPCGLVTGESLMSVAIVVENAFRA